MKNLLFILLLLPAQILSAQQSEKTFKTQLKNGFCEENTKRCIKKQIAYLNACDKIGDYYFKLRKFKLAFKYYELPLELNEHSTNIQIDAAYRLRNKIIAKAGDMIFLGLGLPKDTVNSFHYHFQFPLNYSEGYKKKYSLLYFNTTQDTFQDTFNIQVTDTLKNSFLIGINPFMLKDTGVVKKVADFIDKHISAQSNLHITITRGGIPMTEEGQAMLHSPLIQIKELLEEKAGKHIIEIEVDFDDSTPTKTINGRSIPTFIISSI